MQTNITTARELLELYAARKADIDGLEEEIKALKSANADLEKVIIAKMADMADSAGITLADLKVIVDNKVYTASRKGYYTIRKEDRDAGFEALKETGLGWLITEKVDDRSLTNALNAAAEENGGELPEVYASLPLQVFEKTVLSGRQAGRKGK